MARTILTRAVPGVVAVLIFGVLSIAAWAQVEPAHEGGGSSKCGKPFQKALQYCLDNLPKASFMEKIAIGILLLFEGGHPEQLETCIAAAMRTPGMIGTSMWANWYIGFGAFFLTEVYKRYPREDIKACLEEIIEKGAEHQEPTGGWFSKKGAAKPAKYPGEDHGQLTAMIFSAMISMKKLGMKVPAQTLSLTEAYMLKQCGSGGITYGTGNGMGDTTGSRGGFAIVGLDFVGRRDHKVVSTYQSLFPRCFPKLRDGHHIGGWHFMGVILGCATLGSDMLAQLYQFWAAKLIAEQREDSGFYLGDDKASEGRTGAVRRRPGVHRAREPGRKERGKGTHRSSIGHASIDDFRAFLPSQASQKPSGSGHGRPMQEHPDSVGPTELPQERDHGRHEMLRLFGGCP